MENQNASEVMSEYSKGPARFEDKKKQKRNNPEPINFLLVIRRDGLKIRLCIKPSDQRKHRLKRKD